MKITRDLLRSTFCFHLCTTFNKEDFFYIYIFFYLRDIFYPESLETKKTHEWGMNEIFKTNVEVIVKRFSCSQ